MFRRQVFRVRRGCVRWVESLLVGWLKVGDVERGGSARCSFVRFNAKCIMSAATVHVVVECCRPPPH